MNTAHRRNIGSADVKKEIAHVQQPIAFNLHNVRLIDNDSSRAIIDRVLFDFNQLHVSAVHSLLPAVVNHAVMDVHREAVRRRHAILAPKHARIAENQIAAVQRNSRRAVRQHAARDHAELSLRFLARVDSDRRAVRDFAVVEREGAQQAKADFGAQNGEMDGHEMMERALEVEAELTTLDGRIGDEELAERVHGRGNVEMDACVLDLMESAGFDGNGGIAANSITGRSEEAVLKTNLVKKGKAYLLLLSVRFRIVWAISVPSKEQ